MIDIFTQYEGNRLAAWESLRAPIIGGLCLVVYVEVMLRTMGFLMERAVPNLQADIRLTLFDYVQHHSPHYFNERFAGNLANKITDMTTQVEMIFNELFWPIIPSLTTCLLGAGFLWFIHPIFAWILIDWIPIDLGICLLFMKSCAIYEHQHGEARSTLLGKMVDSLTNNFAVKLFYRFKHEKEAITPFQKDEESTNRLGKRHVEKMRIILSVFSCFFTTKWRPIRYNVEHASRRLSSCSAQVILAEDNKG